MRSILKYTLIGLYYPIMILEKLYWNSWREYQKTKFSSIGKNVHIGRYCFFTNKSIKIGNNVYIGPGCRFQSTKSVIHIGNQVMFGPNVSIHGGNHRIDFIGRFMFDIKEDEKLEENDAPVVIEDDVWIGANAIILKGTRIGEGSVIGAGTVVNFNVPAYSIVTGSKSLKIRGRWNEEEIKKHKEILKPKSR